MYTTVPRQMCRGNWMGRNWPESSLTLDECKNCSEEYNCTEFQPCTLVAPYARINEQLFQSCRQRAIDTSSIATQAAAWHKMVMYSLEKTLRAQNHQQHIRCQRWCSSGQRTWPVNNAYICQTRRTNIKNFLKYSRTSWTLVEIWLDQYWLVNVRFAMSSDFRNFRITILSIQLEQSRFRIICVQLLRCDICLASIKLEI